MAQSSTTQNSKSLANITILKGLSQRGIERVQAQCTLQRFLSGEVVLDWLQPSDDVFFVLEGHARVIVHAPSGSVVSFRDLGPGDSFGEIAAIDGGPRSAGVEACSDCITVSLPAGDFRNLLDSEPAVARELLVQQAGTIRRLTSRVYEFSAAVMGITGRRIYSEVQGIRASDIYPDEEVKAHLVDKTFPKSAEDMTLRLSNVSAAFYGLMLKHVGQTYGWSEVDGLSRRVFRDLGRLKTREALEEGVSVPKDCRAPAVVFITAVHSASPEYNFHVIEYLPDDTLIRVFGTSRYDRIAKKLDIEQHLTWPELTPFFEGIAEELGIDCKIETDLKELGVDGHYDCMYRFRCNEMPAEGLANVAY